MILSEFEFVRERQEGKEKLREREKDREKIETESERQIERVRDREGETEREEERQREKEREEERQREKERERQRERETERERNGQERERRTYSSGNPQTEWGLANKQIFISFTTNFTNIIQQSTFAIPEAEQWILCCSCVFPRHFITATLWDEEMGNNQEIGKK